MSRAFTVEHLPTPLKKPATRLQFLITWDCARPIPYDADAIIHDAMHLACSRLESSRINHRVARPECRA